MEGPISFWGYKEQESNLILPEHDDDDDDDDDLFIRDQPCALGLYVFFHGKFVSPVKNNTRYWAKVSPVVTKYTKAERSQILVM